MSGCAGVISSQVAKPAKPAPSACISAIACGRDQLGALAAEEIGVGDHEVLDTALGGEGCEVIRHELIPVGWECE